MHRAPPETAGHRGLANALRGWGCASRGHRQNTAHVLPRPLFSKRNATGGSEGTASSLRPHSKDETEPGPEPHTLVCSGSLSNYSHIPWGWGVGPQPMNLGKRDIIQPIMHRAEDTSTCTLTHHTEFPTVCSGHGQPQNHGRGGCRFPGPALDARPNKSIYLGATPQNLHVHKVLQGMRWGLKSDRHTIYPSWPTSPPTPPVCPLSSVPPTPLSTLPQGQCHQMPALSGGSC